MANDRRVRNACLLDMLKTFDKSQQFNSRTVKEALSLYSLSTIEVCITEALERGLIRVISRETEGNRSRNRVFEVDPESIEGRDILESYHPRDFELRRLLFTTLKERVPCWMA